MSRKLPKKIANYRRRYHWLRRTEVMPMGPFYINVEPTNACNLKCHTCSLDGSRKRGVMDLDLFRQIIDQCPDAGVYEVALFLAGEPLLNKDVPYMIEYIESKGLESWLVTNACFLDRETSSAILDAGLSNMWISFDGDNKEDYEAMRVGANFEEVVDNIVTFLTLKKEKGIDKPDVSIQMLKLLENPHQQIRPEFTALFEGLPLNGIMARNPHDWRGEKNGIKQEHWGERYFPCQVFWSAMSIAWDGRVVGCSADLNGKFIFGDLHQQTILEIWNGEEMRRHRRLLKEQRYSELALCADCHALWYEKNPKIHIISQLPPFEQIKPVIRRFYNPR